MRGDTANIAYAMLWFSILTPFLGGLSILSSLRIIIIAAATQNHICLHEPIWKEGDEYA